MLEYQSADTKLTLASGLSEYYASRDDLLTGRGMSEMAREFFRCHDTAHVVFGCGTTLLNEAIVKMWSFFGTTRGLRLLREYRLPESKEIYSQLAWGLIARTGLQSVSVVPRVMTRCMRMSKRWPWDDFEAYLEAPLQDVRHEYGIQVLTLDA